VHRRDPDDAVLWDLREQRGREGETELRQRARADAALDLLEQLSARHGCPRHHRAVQTVRKELRRLRTVVDVA
jgi:hypothetical protein